jgi:hypothetical protein
LVDADIRKIPSLATSSPALRTRPRALLFDDGAIKAETVLPDHHSGKDRLPPKA